MNLGGNYTPWKINMTLENHQFQWEIHLLMIHFGGIPSLKLTFSPLKMDGWKMTSPFGGVRFWGFRPIFQGFWLLVSGRGMTSPGWNTTRSVRKGMLWFFRIQIIPYNLEFCYLLDVDGNSDPKNHSPLNGEVLKQCAFHPRVYTQSMRKIT